MKPPIGSVKFQTNATNSDIKCVEASYMKSIRDGMMSTNSKFELQVYNALLNLYADLKAQLHPKKLNKSFVVVPGNLTNIPSHILIHPISFGIPEENIVASVPPKRKAFGRVIPGDYDTYYETELLYTLDMSRSIFTVTCKKMGWDCLRHLEILAAGSLPLFVDVSACYSDAIALHPKRLYNLLLSYPGLSFRFKRNDTMSINFDRSDFDAKSIDDNISNHDNHQGIIAIH